MRAWNCVGGLRQMYVFRFRCMDGDGARHESLGKLAHLVDTDGRVSRCKPEDSSDAWRVNSPDQTVSNALCLSNQQ